MSFRDSTDVTLVIVDANEKDEDEDENEDDLILLRLWHNTHMCLFPCVVCGRNKCGSQPLLFASAHPQKPALSST